MSSAGWLETRVDEIIAAGSITRHEWAELFERLWDDGVNSPAEAAQMDRLLAAMNTGTVQTIR